MHQEQSHHYSIAMDGPHRSGLGDEGDGRGLGEQSGAKCVDLKGDIHEARPNSHQPSQAKLDPKLAKRIKDARHITYLNAVPSTLMPRPVVLLASLLAGGSVTRHWWESGTNGQLAFREVKKEYDYTISLARPRSQVTSMLGRRLSSEEEAKLIDQLGNLTAAFHLLLCMCAGSLVDPESDFVLDGKDLIKLLGLSNDSKHQGHRRVYEQVSLLRHFAFYIAHYTYDPKKVIAKVSSDVWSIDVLFDGHAESEKSGVEAVVRDERDDSWHEMTLLVRAGIWAKYLCTKEFYRHAGAVPLALLKALNKSQQFHDLTGFGLLGIGFAVGLRKGSTTVTGHKILKSVMGFRSDSELVSASKDRAARHKMLKRFERVIREASKIFHIDFPSQVFWKDSYFQWDQDGIIFFSELKNRPRNFFRQCHEAKFVFNKRDEFKAGREKEFGSLEGKKEVTMKFVYGRWLSCFVEFLSEVGIGQKELADFLKKSQGSVSKVLNGYAVLRKEDRLKLENKYPRFKEKYSMLEVTP